MFPGDLELDALFEDHGVCSAVIADFLALEGANYRRCAPGQLANRGKSARLLTDLVAVFALPLHTSGFDPSTLGPGSDRGDNDIDLSDILALVAAVLARSVSAQESATADLLMPAPALGKTTSSSRPLLSFPIPAKQRLFVGLGSKY